MKETAIGDRRDRQVATAVVSESLRRLCRKVAHENRIPREIRLALLRDAGVAIRGGDPTTIVEQCARLQRHLPVSVHVGDTGTENETHRRRLRLMQLKAAF